MEVLFFWSPLINVPVYDFDKRSSRDQNKQLPQEKFLKKG
ncbi:hypothetical protein LV84_02689 [Algoriphagus ratkowskyi]|uniref:Uncharacterized protein n=1 Tax=Algoriphagus ratkowskyi TaxID=57028 RepID=A0A2W7R5T4_9BACT|nr:hypothetical protein LV84_02689 [Algoriphagus ratkowskyi]